MNFHEEPVITEGYRNNTCEIVIYFFSGADDDYATKNMEETNFVFILKLI